jgi:tetratricopeptide (TPR) repeat protein
MKKYSIENKLVLARKFIEEDISRAVSYYDIVFNQKPELMTEEDFIDLALAYEDLNQLEKGVQVYLALLESFPESDRGYYGLGVLSEELDQPEEAILHYAKAIDKNDKFLARGGGSLA